MSIMFANRGQQPGAGHLYEVKAGRSEMGPGPTPEKRKVTAVPGQGLLYFKHSPEDQLLHLYWKTLQANSPEVDLIIFPGETEFIRMKECSDGRVFMLKFKNSEERRFFWLQEQPDEAKDKEIEKKVNELLTNPQPVPARIPTAAGRGADRNQQQPPQQLGAAALNNALGANLDELGPFGNMDQNQLMRLISMMNGGGGNVNMADLLPQLGQMQGAAAGQPPQPATPPPPLSSLIRRGTGGVPATQSTTTGPSAAGNSEGGGGSSAPPPLSAQMLSQIISAMGPSNAEELQKRASAAVDLSTVLTRRNTSEVVNKYSDRLSPLLPGQQPMQSPEAELAQTVGNPQFQQAADFIGTALQLGQMGAALEQFQLNGEVVEAAKKGDLVRFAEKLTAQEGKAEADQKIEADADAEENVESALKREAAAKQAKEEEKVAAEKKPPPPPPPAGDNMDLD